MKSNLCNDLVSPLRLESAEVVGLQEGVCRRKRHRPPQQEPGRSGTVWRAILHMKCFPESDVTNLFQRPASTTGRYLTALSREPCKPPGRHFRRTEPSP